MGLPNIEGKGNLVADPEIRFTKNGKAVSKVRVACDKRQQNQQGEWETVGKVFLNVKLWGDAAEAAAEDLRKGSRVKFTGKLDSDDWVDRDGNRRIDFVVIGATVRSDVYTSEAGAEPGEPAPF